MPVRGPLLKGDEDARNLKFSKSAFARAGAGYHALELIDDAVDDGQLQSYIFNPGKTWAAWRKSDINAQLTYFEQIDAFLDILIEPVIDFIETEATNDELIESATMRYKWKAEWFDAERLKTIADDKPEEGHDFVEARLKREFASYLFDRGVPFALEAQETGTGGEVDVYLMGTDSERHGVVEVKVFDGGGRDARHVFKGVRQASRYGDAFNAHHRYLLVFNVTEPELQIGNAEFSRGYWKVTHGAAGVEIAVINVGMTKSPSKKDHPAPTVINFEAK